ncbi:hypothetical protein Bbelb_234840 [Branchiostoma belcheri]|nr:hypothetical protein Bbelb_234840 [Branchiostoma belcheri]
MGGCPAIRPKCRRPSLTGDTSERARLGVRASTTALRRREKMGGCPAIRPKCRRPSLTGDTSERARLGVRASTTALRRRGKDGRTGDTSERARLEVRASTTALRRRGKDGRTGDTSERARLEVRASTTALRRRGKDGRRSRTSSTGLTDDLAPGGRGLLSWSGVGRVCCSAHLRKVTNPKVKQRRGNIGGYPAIQASCRRSSQTGDTSERARLEVRASTTALRRRGKDGRVPGD